MSNLLHDRDRIPRDAQGWVNWKGLFETLPLNSSRKICDNTYFHRDARGVVTVRFYRTELFNVYDDGTFTLAENVAATSRTTRVRLSALLPYGCCPIKDGERYCLKTPQGVTPLSATHQVWNALGRVDLPEGVNRLNFPELRKKISAYARTYVRQLLKGELLDDASRPRRYCQICETDWFKKKIQHVLQHLEEERTPPVHLLFGAMRQQGLGMTSSNVVDNCTPYYLKRLRRNMRRSRRDPEKIIERTEHRLRTGKPPPVEYVAPEKFRKEFERALTDHLLWHLDYA